MMNRYLCRLVRLVCITKDVNNIWWKNCDKKISISEKKLCDFNCERLENRNATHKSNLTGSDNNMYLTVDSLLQINNIITDSNKITLTKVNI